MEEAGRATGAWHSRVCTENEAWHAPEHKETLVNLRERKKKTHTHKILIQTNIHTQNKPGKHNRKHKEMGETQETQGRDTTQEPRVKFGCSTLLDNPAVLTGYLFIW